MILDDAGLLVGAVALGAVHGVEPGHGWPVAASYALDRTNKWLYGFAASFILGVGHLISSIAMVGAFFYAKSYFNLTQINEPLTIVTGIRIGGPVSLVAGVLLIGLGVREYRHGHSHDTHGGEHSHQHESHDDVAERGLLGIAWFAFLLGFAHEEEFEIIALCAGSNRCLGLMSAYAATVIIGIVGLTMLLIAGYQHHEQKVEQYAPYLPAFSAAVLFTMGLGFITGLL